MTHSIPLNGAMDPPSIRQAGGELDLVLLRLCATGDAEALRRLYDRYEGQLGQYLYRLLGSREDAEEALVDLFVRVWRGASGFRGETPVRTWLYRIALRLALDRLRRRRREQGASVPFDDLEAQLFGPGGGEPEGAFFATWQKDRDGRALRLALQQLKPIDRAVLAMHYFEGRSYAQIQEITGHTFAALKDRLYRARQRLKQHFVRLRESDEALEIVEETENDWNRDAFQGRG